MDRYLLRVWLGIGLVAGAGLPGCSSSQRTPEATVVTPVVQKSQVEWAATPQVLAQAVPEAPKALPEVLPATHVVTEDRDRQTSLYNQVRNRLQERRSFGDCTANPAFAHDVNYHWLVGAIEKGPHDEMGLRYASVDEEDRYGGHVTLSSAQSLSDYQPGQVVRVEGQVTTQAASDFWPTYQVQTITRVQDR